MPDCGVHKDIQGCKRVDTTEATLQVVRQDRLREGKRKLTAAPCEWMGFRVSEKPGLSLNASAQRCPQAPALIVGVRSEERHLFFFFSVVSWMCLLVQHVNQFPDQIEP